MKHVVRRRLMYLGFQGLRAVVQAVPLRLARRLGGWLGGLAYLLLPAQRRLALDHLAYAFGDQGSRAERLGIVRRVFRNLGYNAVEWMALSTSTPRDLQRLVACEGLERLRAALAQGNGVIVITAHFGNWELIPLYLRSLGFEGAVLARRLRYSEYESFLIALRGRAGIPTLARGSMKEVAQLLRANQIVGMLPDQDIDSLEGVFVDFFGHPAYTPIGPSALSRMTGAPIVPCFLIRSGETFRLVIEEPLRASAAADRKQAMTDLTAAWSRVMEAHIRRHPDHWVWMHRRWKTQPNNAQGSGLGAEGGGPEPRAQSPEPTPVTPIPPASRAATQLISMVLLTAYCLLLTAAGGCAKSQDPSRRAAPSAETASSDATQSMSEFSLTGYSQAGSAQWTLNGHGASLDGQVVTIRRPDAVGHDPGRTAYLSASLAQMNQQTRHVRMEHDVTIHTSDGLWLTTPVLHWMPDSNRVATDLPVRIETDHMLLRGRGMEGFTQLKEATILQDIELVLNPTEQERGAPTPQQVTITCEGPLTFDYARHVATFNRNVHVVDPSGELFSDTLVAYLNPATNTIRYAEAAGHVRMHQQQHTATSERAVYEPAIGKITLLGRPSLLIVPSPAPAPAAAPAAGRPMALSFGGLIEPPGAAHEEAAP